MENCFVMEHFNIDPLRHYEDLNNYFEDGSIFMQEALTEATGPTTKKGIISKIWSFIKRTIEWISKQWKRFMGWVSKLMGRKVVSSDQIVIEEIPSIKEVKSSDKKEEEINIRYTDENGKKTEEVYKLAYKDLSLKIDNDQVVFVINRIKNGALDNSPREGYIPKGVAVPGNIVLQSSPEAFSLLFAIFQNEDIRERFVQSVELFKTVNWNDDESIDKLVRTIKSVNDMFSSVGSYSLDKNMKIEDIKWFDKMISEMHLSLSEYSDLENLPGVSPNVAGALNYVSTFIMKLQIGINTMTSSMNRIHEIDAKYIGKVDNVEDLNKFVIRCIKSNIPTKYIAYNIYSLASDRLKGTANQMDPRMGQSRFVLMPSDEDVVYKFALNMMGLRSNTTEVEMYNIAKRDEFDAYFARVIKSYDYNATLVMEKLQVGDTTDQEAASLGEAINTVLRALNYKYRVVDVHHNNVARRGDQLVVIDYGEIRR